MIHHTNIGYSNLFQNPFCVINRYNDNNLSEVVFISSYLEAVSNCQSIFAFVK